jgi:hypothetical protein
LLFIKARLGHLLAGLAWGLNELIFILCKTGEIEMNLSAPKQMTFIVAVVLALLGILATLIPLGISLGLATWIIVIGFIVLAAGCFVPNL